MKRIWRLILKYQVAGTAVALLLIALIGFYSIQRANIDQQYRDCKQSNEFRQLFRDYLERESLGVDEKSIFSLPGYIELGGNQIFAISLVNYVNGKASSSKEILSRYEEDFPIRDCKQLKRKAENDRFWW